MNESKDKMKTVHSWFLTMSVPCETDVTHFTFVEKLQHFFQPKLYSRYYLSWQYIILYFCLQTTKKIACNSTYLFADMRRLIFSPTCKFIGTNRKIIKAWFLFIWKIIEYSFIRNKWHPFWTFLHQFMTRIIKGCIADC